MNGIQTKGLTVMYPAEEQTALPPLDLDITPGENILLLGPSGCGKSTLTLALQGLIPRVMDAERTGEILVNGADPQHWETSEACRHVGILFQDPETQFCMETVEDEIIFGMENIGLSIGEIETRLEEVLAITGLEKRRSDRLSSLSGGLKQKAAIACLLALDSEIFLLDEPTANLDPESREDILQLWLDLSERRNKTVLLMEHKMETGLEAIDRVIALQKDGGVLAEGPPRILFRQQSQILEQEGIRIPEVCRYARQVEQEGAVTWDPFPLTLHEWEIQCRQHGWTKIEKPERNIVRPSSFSSPLIEADNLSFSYEEKRILHDISFTLQAGDFTALIGANGAGKSTLARLLTGIEKPGGGTLLRNGVPSSHYRTDDIMKQTGFVFQNPEHQFICDTVEDELTYGWRISGESPESWKTELENMLDLFQLQEKRHANPFSLSQGQKRRLSVATMVTSGQELLILDEPTFGQDEAGTRALMSILQQLHEKGKTILMITHDMELVDQYAETIILLHDGSIAYEGATDPFFEQNQLLQKASVQAPVTRELRRWTAAPERQGTPC
ncbi:ABC transporter ATP-binding protein [Salibacterium sp. K-3]